MAEQLRRSNRYGKCPTVDVNEGIFVTFSQERFLSNSRNKSQLIAMLSPYSKNDGNKVINCPSDADTTICETALTLASSGEKEVTLVADDTDILVMLIYHWKLEMKDITFFQHRMRRGWKIPSLFPRLDKVKDHIHFVHAMTGCDKTLAPYSKGKKAF